MSVVDRYLAHLATCQVCEPRREDDSTVDCDDVAPLLAEMGAVDECGESRRDAEPDYDPSAEDCGHPEHMVYEDCPGPHDSDGWHTWDCPTAQCRWDRAHAYCQRERKHEGACGDWTISVAPAGQGAGRSDAVTGSADRAV